MALCIAQVAATAVELSETEGLDLVAERFLDWLHHGAPSAAIRSAAS